MKSKKIIKRNFIIHILLFILAGILFILWTWNRSITNTKNEAISIARTEAAGISNEQIKEVAVSETEHSKIEYLQLVNRLKKFVTIDPKIRYAYLYIKRNNKIYFLADSSSSGKKYLSPASQQYKEADHYTYYAEDSNHPIVAKPSKDRWGTWISIFVPIRDKLTGKQLAVFGIDYPVEKWYNYAIAQVIQSVCVAICLLLMLIAYILVYYKKIEIEEEKQKLSELNSRLGEQDKLFRTIYEQSPIGITFGSPQYDISNANKKFQQITGRSKDELSELVWTDITYPEDIEKDMNLYNKFKNGSINGYSLKKRYVQPDGSVRWVNMTIAPLKIEGRSGFDHICLAEDITENVQTENFLKESERNNAMLLSNLPGMAYRCLPDKNWMMQFVSEGSLKLTGYQPESLINNKELSYFELIDKEFRDDIRAKWMDVLDKKEIFIDEYTMITASGEKKWVYEQGQGVFKEQGELIAVEGMIIDITAHKKREDEINYMSFHDSLTGIYNRSTLDEAKSRLDKEEFYPLSVIVGDINGLKHINSAKGHEKGDLVIKAAAKILNSCCGKKDVLARTGGDEFTILMPKAGYEDAYALINKITDRCKNYIIQDDSYKISISLGCASKDSSEISLSSIIKDAEESMYRHKLVQKKSPHSSIISSMKSSLYEKSHETEEHANRLIELSRAIGKKMKLVEEQMNELELLAMLHDIGKIGINDNILNKPGKLTESEWVEMRKHPEMGYRIAMSTPELTPIANYILCHHERWDGSGYPRGLEGDKIPLLSRIIAVADAYDAMTSDRSYRKAMDKESAIEEIKKNTGTQFDPEVVAAFFETF